MLTKWHVTAEFAHANAVALPASPTKLLPPAIVKFLKWTTTVGSATDALLEVLHERAPGTPYWTPRSPEAGRKLVGTWRATSPRGEACQDPSRRPGTAPRGR